MSDFSHSLQFITAHYTAPVGDRRRARRLPPWRPSLTAGAPISDRRRARPPPMPPGTNLAVHDPHRTNADNPLPPLAMVAAVKRAPVQRFTGALYLRHRLVLATLSGRTVIFSSIRASSPTAPGLTPAEISFVRLLDKLTSASVIEINATGTSLRFRPGLLSGPASARATHDCHPSRALAYYLEPLLMLAPFCAKPLALTLRGPTHGALDPSADAVAAVSVPLLRRITLGTPLEPALDVVRRGAASPHLYAGGRGGVAVFSCGVLAAKVAPVELVERGVVKRVRGLAFSNRVSPAYLQSMVDAVRRSLNRFTPDVYVHTDHGNAAEGGAGFGVGLVAETSEGCLIGGDWAAVEKEARPAAVAGGAVNMLLDQVAQGGCVDGQNACLALLMCALSDSDISRVRVGRLSDAVVVFLRDLKTFFGVVFKVTVDEDAGKGGGEGGSGRESSSEEESEDEEEDEEERREPISGGIVMSCVGIGLVNTARQRF